MIIRDVPYIGDTGEEYASCQGPPTTLMALQHFSPGLDMNFSDLYTAMDYRAGKWFFEMYIVMLFYKLGINAIFYSTQQLKKCTDKETFRRISGLNYESGRDVAEFDLEHFQKSSPKNASLQTNESSVKPLMRIKCPL